MDNICSPFRHYFCSYKTNALSHSTKGKKKKKICVALRMMDLDLGNARILNHVSHALQYCSVPC